MANKGIAKFKRKEAFSNYKILFIIVTEGETEENYFTMLKRLKRENIEIVCKKGKHSDAENLIRSIDREIKERELNEHSEGWIILDNDVLTPDNINKLQEWMKSTGSKPRKSVGLSSPMFEYWLLLHFEVPVVYVSNSDCIKYLKNRLPKYRKPFHDCARLLDRVSDACENAKQKSIMLGSADNGTNLHHLVSRLH